ncbi:MAG TPA: hypothetical protein VG963_09905 [Polyangiaceae bacterium]|nr:hypothetical protein [Polyangiaceae bacterium]
MNEEANRQRELALQKAINPKNLPVYSGPIGAVQGVVHVTGDPSPIAADRLAKLPAAGCAGAQEMLRHVFREGPGRTLGDVLVTVTEYPGFVPPREEGVRVEIKGCAFDSNVVAMAFGQHLEVFNLDAQGYVPRIVGPHSYALRVALPGGSPVPLFVPQPGHYFLVDETHEYMRADLFVLSYPTFEVTRLDGRFEIKGIPTGDVKVTAFSPALGKVSEQRVKIQAGVTAQLSFDLAFSRDQYDAALRSKASQDTLHARDAGAAH